MEIVLILIIIVLLGFIGYQYAKPVAPVPVIVQPEPDLVPDYDNYPYYGSGGWDGEWGGGYTGSYGAIPRTWGRGRGGSGNFHGGGSGHSGGGGHGGGGHGK